MTDTDRTPTGEATAPGEMRQDATVDVQEAARRLGVSTDAVRSRLRRGTLEGHKRGDEWRVVLSTVTGSRQDTAGAQQDATGNRQDATVEGARTRQDAPPAVDLAPLTALIDDLTQRNADLAAAAAMWQTRAAHLENELKQLTAGEHQAEANPEAGTIASESPRNGETTPSGIRAWLRRLWVP